MAKFSEKDAETLFNRIDQGWPERECRKAGCDAMFTPATKGQRYCDNHRAVDRKTYECLEPKRKRGRPRKARTKVGSGDDAPLDDGYAGTSTKCPTCNATYDPTLYGRKKPSNVKQWTEMIKRVGYDKYRCFCGHTWHRYT